MCDLALLCLFIVSLVCGLTFELFVFKLTCDCDLWLVVIVVRVCFVDYFMRCLLGCLIFMVGYCDSWFVGLVCLLIVLYG